MIGGFTEIKAADANIQKLCNRLVKENAQLLTYPLFKAIEYKSQLVNGVNYTIKVQVRERDECVFIKCHESFPRYDSDRLEKLGLTLEEQKAYIKSTQKLTLNKVEEGYTLFSYLK